MFFRKLAIVCLILTFVTPLCAEDDEDVFDTTRLPIGNPATKYDFCKVRLGHILDTNGGQEVEKSALADRLKEYRIIMVGESHTAQYHHKMQLDVIQALVESGVEVCLALEFFNESHDSALNDYISGKTNEEEFIAAVDYYNTWGHNYRYYKPIFNYAAEKKIKMFGANIDHDYASKVGRTGLKSLTPEELQFLPEPDTTDAEHRFFFKTAMEGMDVLMGKQFGSIYAAQCLWDAAMGEGAIKAAQENPDAVIVLLAGSGHVVYNLGIGKVIKKRSDFPVASIIAVDVPDTTEESLMMQVKKELKKERQEAVSADSSNMAKKESKMPPAMMEMMGKMDDTPYKIVVRSLADFLWGVPKEDREKYPSFGFSASEKEEGGFKIKRIFPETIAWKQGLQKGDAILSIDGQKFADLTELRRHLAYKNWGESISFQVRRDDGEKEISFNIEKIEDED
ncbi:MAG: hypothetical protein B6244_07350 [Candidatus Cloacimonetes bacterium 4572_55]|nr:MAG: hypothetical protein B6244_07350 [Candidatus Cloacimonetes bacterium 4572_55]